jgi:hypothetical protein
MRAFVRRIGKLLILALPEPLAGDASEFSKNCPLRVEDLST